MVVTHMHACRHTLLMTKCLLQLLQPAFGNGITLALRSMVLDGDEYEGPSSAVTVSNGSGLFSLAAPCLGKGVAQKGTDLSLK